MSSNGKTNPTHPSNDNLPVDGASSGEHHATHEHHATDVKQITNQMDRVTEDKEPNKYGRSLGARVEGGGHDQRDTADVSGDAGVGSSGMGGLASLELGDPGSSRNRKYTEKGFEYKCDLQKRDFQRAVSGWRAAASKAERGLHDADTVHLKGFRDDLELEMACVSAELHNYSQFLSPDHQSVVRENVTRIQQQNRDLLEKITEQIRDTESETSAMSVQSHRSRFSQQSCSGRSRCSDQSKLSQNSSLSIKRAEAAAKAAGLKAKLNFMEAENRHKAELERIKILTELESENARLKAMSADLDERTLPHTISIKPVELNPNAAEFSPNNNTFTQCSPSIREDPSMLLAKALTEQAYVNRLPLPEPGVFTGDPLLFPAWKSSFEALIESRNIPPKEKIHYLKRYIGGPAKEAIDGYFLMTSDMAYEDAKTLLVQRYGDSFVIANAFRDKLDSWPSIPNRDGLALRKFSDYLRQCALAMQENQNLQILNDERENRKLLAKLPHWLVDRWARLVAKYRQSKRNFPPFTEFVTFITSEAELACDPITSTQAIKSSASMQDSVKKEQKRKVGGFVTHIAPKSNEVTCLFCEKKNHKIDRCFAFMKLPMDERKTFFSMKGLCFRCTEQGHRSRECKGKMTCKECDKSHPTCLHGDTKHSDKIIEAHITETPNNSPKQSQPQTNSHVISAHVSFCDSSESYCGKSTMIVPVYVSHRSKPDEEHLIYAMIDTQSDTTFILREKTQELDISGTNTELLLSTLSAEDEIVSSCKIEGLVIRGYDSDKKIPLPATFTRDIMPAARSHIPTRETAMKWPHLHKIANALMPISDCDIALLIGYNCPRALIPREIIPHSDDGPYGILTDLGWSIVGVTDPSQIDSDPIGISHRIMAREVHHEGRSRIVLRTRIKERIVPVQDENKSDVTFTPADVARMMELEFVERSAGQSLSQNDIKFLEVIRSGIHTMENGHYEMPLPIKEPPGGLILPNNRNAALKRLEQLKKRLGNNKVAHESYSNFMEKMILQGHAEEVPQELLNKDDGQVWYVPHHAVTHAKKDKVRVVFDCSARYRGTCLNDHLLQGPDLINRLVGVLCRFRKEQVALMCDIESMFYQFHVNPSQRDLLRFLWWKGGDLTTQPIEYRMTVHVFGAVSSPACANFALRQIASDHEHEFNEETVTFIKRDFYVDDGLSSKCDVESGINLAQDSRALCALGGLRLHKFISNSKEVIQSLPQEDRAKNVSTLDLLEDKLPFERALGVHWHVEKDQLGFNVNLPDHPLTRRGILSCVASIYDPLGLASPVILTGKQILQEMCREGTMWDDPLSEELLPKWKQWHQDLHLLNNVEVARCFKPHSFGNSKEIQLHHFADASLKGYGACSYIRMMNDSGEIHCALVMSKSRVTPLKTITVPRLELTAAVTAIKISQLLEKELHVDEVTHHFWTDSKVVLAYIANESSRFHVYVANRVQTIRNHSEPHQWHHIPTEQNPADLASRGCTASELVRNEMWFNGPRILWEPELPHIACNTELAEDDLEVRKVRCKASSAQELESLQLQRISSWTTMTKVVALCINFQRIIKKAVKPQHLTPTHIHTASMVIVKLLQRETFADELNCLETKSQVKSNSPIASLDPFLDKNGILRVGGRLNQSDLPHAEKHPALLPKGHHISLALIRHYHQQVAHQGRGTTLNALRANGFWVIGATKSVASTISKCVTCRRLRSAPSEQKMGDLPEDRVSPGPPFMNSGVDFFGPFLIKEGRKNLKRWGVMFTCMASRAVHIEVATTLATDGFINALRRFIGIRGNVHRLRSDRGTNFVGASNELTQALKEMSDVEIQKHLLKHNCEFKFNPPNASHMGGVWEIQIRTARRILTSVLYRTSTQLDDDCLRTLFTETASIMNSRPLTVDNLNDPASLSPITPNHLLTMRSTVVVPPPGSFVQADIYSKKRWRRVQLLANQFWSCWKKEFLQTLQQRQKWTGQQRNMTRGDIVIIKEDDTPRGHWKLGRVEECHPSADGIIRSVKIAIGDSKLDERGRRTQPVSYLTRPITKLVLLLESVAAV